MEITEQQAKRLIAVNAEKESAELIQRYQALTPIYFDVAIDYCNNKDLEFDRIIVFLAKAVQFYSHKAGLTARSMGTVSYSYDTDLPSSILQLLKPFKKLRW